MGEGCSAKARLMCWCVHVAHASRAGMISDSAVAEMAQLRRVLAGKEPLLEGVARRQGSALSMLRAGSMLRAVSVMSSGSSRATLVHA